MRIQNDSGLFVSDGVTKQFKFIVSRNTADQLMTSFMMKRYTFKEMEIDYNPADQDSKLCSPGDIGPNNPKVTFTVHLHEAWYYKLLKFIYDTKRYEGTVVLPFEFNKN